VIGYIALFGIAFINMSNVYILFVPGFFIFAANGVLQILTTIFLANTVDYGEMKNNRRDESVIFSMQTFVVKLASGIAAFVAAICLSLNSLSSDEVTEADQAVDFASGVAEGSKLGLRMTMTIIPVIGLIIAVLVFRKKYILTDEKVRELAEEIARKRESEQQM
jgi:melibiose permease